MMKRLTEQQAARMALWIVRNLLNDEQLDVVYRDFPIRFWHKELQMAAGLGVDPNGG